jgi:putrescine transport system ATP-binding protein
MSTKFLEIKNISKKFGNVIALDNVSLSISKSELFSLLGSSGCGKSTLLRIIAGFEKPDSGSIILDGEDITNLPPHLRPLNMMFQNYALFPHLNISQNIEFGLKEENLPKNEILERTREILNLLELTGLEKRKIYEISGGQQQRVALARCLVKKPKLLLLDEPLAALDKKLRIQTQFELVNLQYKLGITFIIVTHDQEEAMSLSDRMAIMRNGNVLQIGNPVEIYEKPINQYIANFIGTANIFSIEGISGDFFLKEIDFKINSLKGSNIYKHCLIRPEKITISKSFQNKDTVKCLGIVKEVAYLGSYTKYLVEVKNHQFYAFMQNSEISGDLKIKWDDKVECSWRDDSIYFFNE